MIDDQPLDPFRQVVRRIDPRATLLRAWPLMGGVSARITAMEVVWPDGRSTKLVVRQHGVVDRERNPHIARDEFALLRIAHAHNLAVPKPYLVAETRDVLPTPFLVVAYVDGETRFAPADVTDYVAQAATHLARIHGIGDPPGLSFLPRRDQGFGERPGVLDASMDEARIRDALEAAWPLSKMNHPVLLHGDYWPGNLLWRDGQLAAVIDWEDAAVGDPLADLANARLELLWWFGNDAMTAFTDRYRSMTTVDGTNLPYWDLCAALRPCSKLSEWGLDHRTEQRLRERHHLFVARALADLTVR